MSALDQPVMWVPSMDAVVSRWFSTYDDARASLIAEGGYLLPYKGQVFVTSREGVRELGLDPDDADWARIGFDWIHPLDEAAWGRLHERRIIAA
jgi:hypothetical protein